MKYMPIVVPAMHVEVYNHQHQKTLYLGFKKKNHIYFGLFDLWNVPLSLFYITGNQHSVELS